MPVPSLLFTSALLARGSRSAIRICRPHPLCCEEGFPVSGHGHLAAPLHFLLLMRQSQPCFVCLSLQAQPAVADHHVKRCRPRNPKRRAKFPPVCTGMCMQRSVMSCSVSEPCESCPRCARPFSPSTPTRTKPDSTVGCASYDGRAIWRKPPLLLTTHRQRRLNAYDTVCCNLTLTPTTFSLCVILPHMYCHGCALHRFSAASVCLPSTTGLEGRVFCPFSVGIASIAATISSAPVECSRKMPKIV